MPETSENGHENLEAENAQLRQENEGLRAENASLKQQIAAMKQQEASMAALFRGAQPTDEGRRANAKQTARNPYDLEQ